MCLDVPVIEVKIYKKGVDLIFFCGSRKSGSISQALGFGRSTLVFGGLWVWKEGLDGGRVKVG